MKIKINVEKKYFTIFAVFICLISVLFVYVNAQIPSGEVGHDGEGVWVEIDGGKYLNSAISDGDFNSAISGSVSIGSCSGLTLLDYHVDYAPYWNYDSNGGDAWTYCGAGEVVTKVESYKWNDNICSYSGPPGTCGEMTIIEIECCSLVMD